MPLPIRPIAVSTAVLCFFAIGIVGSLAGLSPYTCCQRAVLGAAIGCLVTVAAVRAINAIRDPGYDRRPDPEGKRG